MSTLLLVTTERLGQETNRANALDVRCTEVLTHLRTIVGERDQLRRTLTKVQEELSLYKLQLDVAQNEIFRAQKIVDGVDKARVEAEEQAAKDRTLARELVSERAVWQAREEGRNAGFKEGLRQGRRWAYEAVRKRTRSEEYIDDGYDPVYEDPEPYEPSAQHSSSSGHSRGHWSSPSRSVHSTPPDAASYASTVPRTPSDPPNAPSLQDARSAQPQPPRPSSAQPPVRTPSARSSRPLPRAPEHLPEPIDIRRDTRSVRPTSPTRSHFRAPSPSMSHRSVAPPPDGFIPTVGADSVIALPPPHELSRPVSMVAETPTPVTEPRRPETPHRSARARTMSNVSAVSTSLSQFDILSPPRPEPRVTHSDQVAREWRVANADPPEERPRTAGDSKSSENFSTRSSIPRARSQASRRSGPPPAPRRPREIVMPMPLSTTMHGDGMSHMRPSTSAGLRREPAQTYGYGPPAGPSSSAPVAGSSAPPMPPQLQEYSENITTPTRPRSAISWIKSRFNRSLSSSSVPNIQIEPPSNPASNPSTDCTVNTVLLVPEDAGQATLPQHFLPEFASAVEGVQLQPAPPHAEAATGNVIVLPDNELPRGFVPLSPISPIMPNLHTVPPADLAPPPHHPPAPTPSPQPPAYSPRDIYAPGPPRPATAAGTRPRSPFREFEADGSAGGRARGASIGSAMLMSPPLNRPISIFSEA
ncbi:hypothetical protein DFH06DRAFT_1651 [Mycena polygramma]|nr:hypothetical protein DFH06DRAFT_1651 [Mycena polygramma]